MNARTLLIHFSRRWKEAYGDPYRILWGKDGAIFKRLLSTYPYERLIQLIDHYLTDFHSDFASSAGHTVGIFETCLPQIIASLQSASKAQAKPNPDYLILEAARNKLKP